MGEDCNYLLQGREWIFPAINAHNTRYAHYRQVPQDSGVSQHLQAACIFALDWDGVYVWLSCRHALSYHPP